MLALTASATKPVAEDIMRRLKFREPHVRRMSFERANLSYVVRRTEDKHGQLLRIVGSVPGPGIVYVRTREKAETITAFLNEHGIAAGFYHGGMNYLMRSVRQDEWIRGTTRVMVATNAFGMGIDKSNVSFVIHYNMPKNMESYYQEAGRAGRDGEPSRCILLYSGQDVITNRFFIENNQENQELDPVTRALVQERDEERLRKMTFYCFTHECLRDYILRYFGEYGSNYCENCSNCLTEFVETDVSKEAGEIIQCVKACHQRYGVTVILDTLRGASTAKIRQYQMEENPCYGSCREIPIYRLRQIFHYLLEKGYLSLSNDAYTLVKLTGQSEILLQPDVVLIMKMAREEKKKPKTEKESKKTKTKISGVLSQEDEPLFQRLRQLRMEIAREEKVPPYIVFSDKTLVHMCIIKPHDKEEMLTVSGVGEIYEIRGEISQEDKQYTVKYCRLLSTFPG